MLALYWFLPLSHITFRIDTQTDDRFTSRPLKLYIVAVEIKHHRRKDLTLKTLNMPVTLNLLFLMRRIGQC